MNKYGKSARRAVVLFRKGDFQSPKEAWDRATIHYFEIGTASQKKGCPRNAFLGLCENGLVAEIPEGKYTSSILNKQYALAVVKILKDNSSQTFTPRQLWGKVIQGEEKAHNQQLDVVLALWKEGLIR